MNQSIALSPGGRLNIYQALRGRQSPLVRNDKNQQRLEILASAELTEFEAPLAARREYN